MNTDPSAFNTILAILANTIQAYIERSSTINIYL